MMLPPRQDAVSDEPGCFGTGTPREKVREGLFDHGLKSGVGNMMDNDGEDVKWVKNALYIANHRETPAQNGIIEQDTDNAIRSFQKEKGLKIDGVMKPGGETEIALKKELGLKPEILGQGASSREISIKTDIPANFEIKGKEPDGKKPDVVDKIKDTANDIYNLDFLGKRAVEKHDKEILIQAEKHNIDPDLIRAVMFAENARGHKIVFNKAADLIKASESALPMNIQKERWSDLIRKKPEEMYDPKSNIEASAILLKRIRDRIEDPTPEKIGTIWNKLGMHETHQLGDYIGKVYRDKPWKKN